MPILAFLAMPAAVHGADFDLASLFDRLAHERPGRATFHERKFLALLDKPVESSGELVFVPPDRLERRTLKPRPESVVVDRGRVMLERDGMRRSFALRDNPQLAVLVEAIRSTLAGDLGTLTRTYSVALDGTPARWRLVLRPLDTSTAALVERVEIGGSESRVERVEIFQSDGDRSVMSIAPAAP